MSNGVPRESLTQIRGEKASYSLESRRLLCMLALRFLYHFEFGELTLSLNDNQKTFSSTDHA